MTALLRDIEAATLLYERFGELLDRGAGDAWAQLFCEGGVFVLRSGREITGREALEAFAIEFARSAARRSVTPRHQITEVRFRETADGVEGTCRSELFERDVGGPEISVGTARYTDLLVPSTGGWLFARRLATAV